MKTMTAIFVMAAAAVTFAIPNISNAQDRSGMILEPRIRQKVCESRGLEWESGGRQRGCWIPADRVQKCAAAPASSYRYTLPPKDPNAAPMPLSIFRCPGAALGLTTGQAYYDELVQIHGNTRGSEMFLQVVAEQRTVCQSLKAPEQPSRADRGSMQFGARYSGGDRNSRYWASYRSPRYDVGPAQGDFQALEQRHQRLRGLCPDFGHWYEAYFAPVFYGDDVDPAPAVAVRGDLRRPVAQPARRPAPQLERRSVPPAAPAWEPAPSGPYRKGGPGDRCRTNPGYC